MLVTHQILFEHRGEVSYTQPDPARPYTPGEVDLEEEKQALYSSDDWRLTKVKRWQVREVELPAWLSPQEYCRDITLQVRLKFLWGFGADPDWPEAWQRALAFFGETERLACVKLLKTKTFRSEFRASLRRQLVAWLEADPEARQYDSPFSRRQWEALCDCYTQREARQRGERLYWQR